MISRLRVASALLLLGCANPPVPAPASASASWSTERTIAASTPLPSALASLPARATSGATTAPPLPEPCSPTSDSSATAPPELTRIHAGRVLSAAVGVPPRAVVWSGEIATLLEGDRARELPAPHLPAGAAVEIFFGRDNQPRLMGYAPGASGQALPVYLRFRHGVFMPEPSELGPLAAPHGALYGVLGFADPEVVCRPGELCLVKRSTGWGRVAAHVAPAHIVLRAGSVFALHADRVERLDARGWSPLEPARSFVQPEDAWVAPNGELWVVDRSAEGLFHLSNGAWEAVATPIREPHAVFGHADGRLWVLGKNGAAELDGGRFRCLRGATGPLHLALAVGADVWLAGESGVYRLSR